MAYLGNFLFVLASCDLIVGIAVDSRIESTIPLGRDLIAGFGGSFGGATSEYIRADDDIAKKVADGHGEIFGEASLGEGHSGFVSAITAKPSEAFKMPEATEAASEGTERTVTIGASEATEMTGATGAFEDTGITGAIEASEATRTTGAPGAFDEVTGTTGATEAFGALGAAGRIGKRIRGVITHRLGSGARNTTGGITNGIIQATKDVANRLQKAFNGTYEEEKNSVTNSFNAVKKLMHRGIETAANLTKTKFDLDTTIPRFGINFIRSG